MSLPKYPEYRESGVEWIGKVPAHWDIRPLKAIAYFVGGGTPSKENLSFWKGSIPWVSPKDMKEAEITDSEDHISEEAVLSTATQMVPAGNVLLVFRSGILKHTIPVAINAVSVALNQDMKCLVVDRMQSEPTYLFRFIQGLNTTLLPLWAKQGATVESLETGFVCNSPFPLPPLPEQRAIATFLDRECGKIDALIAEQERLIVLLEEKRQAVVSHAVTKGLDPNAPMKDSGISWIGMVPEEWEVKPLKHVLISLDQGWSPQCENYPRTLETEWAVLKVGCVNTGVFDETENKILPSDLEGVNALVVRSGDVLVSRANTRDLVGRASTVERDYPRLMICDKLFRLRVISETCHPSYLSIFLQSSPARHVIELAASGASQSMVNIGQSTILEMPFPVPPLAEQTGILDLASDQTTQSLRETSRLITLARERRAALISAAVTGKIDVRGLVDLPDAA